MVVTRSLCVALALATALAAPPTAARAAGSADDGYGAVRDAYLALEGSPEKQKYRDNYLKILDGFEGFVKAHPSDPRAADALYNAGRLAWDLYRVSRVEGDYDRAVALLERLAGQYPKDNLADDGLFLVGRIRLEHGDEVGAARAFSAVVHRFPEGDMVGKAREMLRRLSPAARAAGKAEAPRVASAAGKPDADDEAARARPPTANSKPQTAPPAPVPAGPARVTAVSARDAGDFTRVTLALTGPVTWKEGAVRADPAHHRPRRVYLDLSPAILAKGAATAVKVSGPRLARVRTGQFAEHTVRVVLDLGRTRGLEVYPMAGTGALVIDVTRSGDHHAPVARTGTTAPAAPKATPHQTPTLTAMVPMARPARAHPDKKRLQQMAAVLKHKGSVPLAVQAGLKIRRVVVDAGHGGKDDGAVGPHGLKEKDVALSIAKMLGQRLKHYGLDVIYTRTDDRFVPLEERTDIANAKGADLFISIHCNASTSRARHGVATYYLNVTGNRYEMRLAARENATSKKSVSDLRLILADLATQADTDESVRLATQIQSHTVGFLRHHYRGIHDRGVKNALFYVLLGARMPAVLVETSFISNRREARRLHSHTYRERVAQGIFEGVKAFLRDRRAVALGAHDPAQR